MIYIYLFSIWKRYSFKITNFLKLYMHLKRHDLPPWAQYWDELKFKIQQRDFKKTKIC